MVDWWTVAFYMIGFAVLPTSGFVLSNLITRGLLWKVVRVFALRRRGGVLVEIHTVTGPYYRVGHLEENFMYYKPRHNKLPNGNKIRKVVHLRKGTITREMWVPKVIIDEETGNVLDINWKVVPGHDTALTDGLMKRIAMLKPIQSKREIFMMIGIGLTLAVVIYIAINQGHIQKVVEALNQVGAAQGNLIQ